MSHSKKKFPGKKLSDTQTCSSRGNYAPGVNISQGSMHGRPDRAMTSHPSGAQLPGKGLTGTQTRNHPPIER